MNIGLLSSFLPSNNGIAEFTDDFETAIQQSDTTVTIKKIVIVDPADIHTTSPTECLFSIQKEQVEDYIRAAETINASSIDILVIQHEFATYGGPNGAYLTKLIHRVKKPMVLIAHTVPVADDAHHIIERKQFFQSIHDAINNIIVFLPQAKQTLSSYGFEEDKITIIPHAVKVMPTKTSSMELRRKFGFPPDAFIVFSFGFFHANKGTLYTIQAINTLVQQKRNIFFVYAGTTLPSAESEEYFKSLHEFIHKNHLEQHVHIHLDFITQNMLSEYLAVCDVGIVPYIYKSYTASGPLSFFIGAGKPIITTSFAYATSILSPQSACFVPFENAEAIAQAIIKLQDDQDYHQSLEKECIHVRSSITWEVIAKRYLQTIHEITQHDHNDNEGQEK